MGGVKRGRLGRDSCTTTVATYTLIEQLDPVMLIDYMSNADKFFGKLNSVLQGIAPVASRVSFSLRGLNWDST